MAYFFTISKNEALNSLEKKYLLLFVNEKKVNDLMGNKSVNA